MNDKNEQSEPSEFTQLQQQAYNVRFCVKGVTDKEKLYATNPY